MGQDKGDPALPSAPWTGSEELGKEGRLQGYSGGSGCGRKEMEVGRSDGQRTLS